MSEEIRAEEMQAGGESDAQNPSANEPQLQQPAPDASVPEGKAGSGAPGVGGAEGPAAEQGTAGEKAPAAADAEGASQEAEAGAAQTGDNRDHEGEAQSDHARAETATLRLAEALASAAIEKAGIPPARAKYAARLMDTSHIDPLADDAAQKYADAVRHLVEDIPELVPFGGTGSSGDHARRLENPNEETVSAFRRGMGR